MLFIIFQVKWIRSVGGAQKNGKDFYVENSKVIATNAHFIVKSITSTSNKVLFIAHNYPTSDTR